MLEGADNQNPLVAAEAVFGAVAVVDVEVDHRNTRQVVRRQCMRRRDGDVVEETETHRRGPFGVMAGRPHGAEGVLGLP